jgi:hypothetical protein
LSCPWNIDVAIFLLVLPFSKKARGGDGYPGGFPKVLRDTLNRLKLPGSERPVYNMFSSRRPLAIDLLGILGVALPPSLP